MRTTAPREIESELRELKRNFNTDIEVRFEKLIGDISKSYQRNTVNQNNNGNNNINLKDSVLPAGVNTNQQLAKYMINNGAIGIIVNGKEMKLTYSSFSKNFYVTNTNNIIIGEPIICPRYDADMNECIKEWKQTNRLYLNKDTKNTQFTNENFQDQKDQNYK